MKSRFLGINLMVFSMLIVLSASAQINYLYVDHLSPEANGDVFAHASELDVFGHQHFAASNGGNPGPGLNFYHGEYDTYGNLLWCHKPENIGTGQILTYSMSADSMGNQFILIHTNNNDIVFTNDTVDLDGTHLIKVKDSTLIFDILVPNIYSTNGNNEVITNVNGFTYLTSTFNLPTTVGTHNLVSNGGTDTYLCKVSPVGDVLWANSWGGTSSSRHDVPRSVCFDSLENVHFMYSQSYLSSDGHGDCILIKMDSSGIEYSNDQFSGIDLNETRIMAYTCSPAGKSYMTFMLIDNSATLKDTVVTAVNSATYLVKYDENNNFIAADKMMDTVNVNFYHLPSELAVNSLEQVFTAGRIWTIDSVEVMGEQLEMGFFVSQHDHNLQRVSIYDFALDQANDNFCQLIDLNANDTSLTFLSNARHNGFGVVTYDMPYSTVFQDLFPVKLSVPGPFPSFSQVSFTDCDTMMSPSGSFILTSTGTYQDTLVNSVGGDSIMTIDFVNFYVDTTIINQTDSLIALADSSNFQWYDCLLGTPISGANSASYTPSVNGSYAVIVTDTISGCQDTSNCINVSHLELQELTEIYAVYPNPSHEFLFINSSRSAVIDKLIVSDVQGKTIIVIDNFNTEKKLDITDLENGVYFLKIESGGLNWSQVFVKN